MRDFASESPARRFLLGNEAIARGALEAGVGVVAVYPGTPSSEIGETFAEHAGCGRYRFEYSVNEKVALEVAASASVAGARSLAAMKHVGVNVAADTLMTLAYSGVRAGMVIVTADDPACHSSQNEQDNRRYAQFANLPMLEPASPDLALRMTREAFELSERLQLPVFLRTTTRLSHMRGSVETGALGPPRAPLPYTRDLTRFVCVPAVARQRHPVLLRQMEQAAAIAEDSPFNTMQGAGRVGVVTSGIPSDYVHDAVRALGIADELRICSFGMVHPLPERKLREFVRSVDRVVVVEELEPVFEDFIAAICAGERVEIIGKRSGHFSRAGELSTPAVSRVLAQATGRAAPEAPVAPPATDLPTRPPTLCPGCPHRGTYYASKVAGGDKAMCALDIGCYTLGFAPPLSMADFQLSMGASVPMAGGFSRVTDKPILSFIGDSTFFHSGITGLVNGVHNGHRFVLVIMDNDTTAMTGHQPHPGAPGPLTGGSGDRKRVDIESIVRATGVEFVETVDAFDVPGAAATFERALAHPGVAVIISKGACALIDRARTDRRPRFEVDPERCCTCGQHGDTAGCGVAQTKEMQWERVLQRSRNLRPGLDAASDPLPAKPAVAPCSHSCPAGVCVQGYVTHLAGGRALQAHEVIREELPFPGVCGLVCPHPCEASCTRAAADSSVAIRELKRHAFESVDRAAVRAAVDAERQRIVARDGTVAVIGSGPAGLTVARELALRGHAVTVFEAAPEPGGMLRYGAPEFRLPKSVVREEIDLIRRLGVEIRCGVRVGRDVSFEQLRAGHDAVFLGLGASRGLPLRVEGEEGDGVCDALRFLADASLGADGGPADEGARRRLVPAGGHAIVVGGGNSAMDAARMALRLGGEGARATILYRRSRAEMPAHAEEIADAEREGVRVVEQMAPVRVLRHADGSVRALLCVKTELGPAGADGRRSFRVVAGSEQEIACDRVVAAIGQSLDTAFAPELRLTDKGTLQVDADTGRTSLPKVFAAGDAVTGPRTVIEAVGAAKRVAHAMSRMLEMKAEVVLPLARTRPPADKEPSWAPGGVRGRARTHVPEPDGSTRDFALHRRSWTLDEARAEAARCLGCGSCARCRVCVETFACPALYLTPRGQVAVDPAQCNGCGVCAQICPNGAFRPVTEARS